MSGVEDLRATLVLVRGRLAMLESSAPADSQDSELRKRIRKTRIEEGVILAKLAEVTAARPAANESRGH
ncbi:MAG: hypothetical protein ACLP3R_02620 [Candidatus Korobacteraceae bacterium]